MPREQPVKKDVGTSMGLVRGFLDPSSAYKELPATVPLLVKDLIKKMLSPDLTEVPDMKEVFLELKVFLGYSKMV